MQSLFEPIMVVISKNMPFIYANLLIFHIHLLSLVPFLLFKQLTNHFSIFSLNSSNF
jgi:hypothetical protein